MKIVDERETQKKKKTLKEHQQRQKRARGNKSYSESVRAK